MLSIRKNRMHISKKISLYTPEQKLQQISLLESFEQKWNPQSQREIKVDAWVHQARNNTQDTKSKKLNNITRQPFKSHRSTSYIRDDSNHDKLNQIATFLSTETNEFKKYSEERQNFIARRTISQRAKSAVLTPTLPNPKKKFQFLRKNSGKRQKSKINSQNRHNLSVSSVTYPILLNGFKKEIFSNPESDRNSPMVGTIYNLLHRRISQRR